MSRRRSTINNGVIVPVVNEQQAPRLQALGEVLQRPPLDALVFELVQEMGEGVAEADDGVEGSVRQEGIHVAVKGFPVSFFDH